MVTTSSAAQIVELLGPSCRDTGRRALLLEQTAVNGIDFVEFEEIPLHHVLHVHFLNDLTAAEKTQLADISKLLVHGGTRIPNVKVLASAPSGTDARVLDVEVDQQGDFSPYLLSIGWSLDPDGRWVFAFPNLDRAFSVAPLNFRPGCPVDFDCAPSCDCPEDVLPEPALDYLAKDYASFRQLLIDLVAQRNPTWSEFNPADVGMALLELFAYEGDNLSYLQDAVANEAFLDTARQRVSAKRHAKLIDYQMHDGRNAWTYVHYSLKSGQGVIPPGKQLVTKISAPMRFDRVPGGAPLQPTLPPGPELHTVTDQDYRTDPALAQVRVFETAATVKVDVLNNLLALHTWGNDNCCRPIGSTVMHVYAVDAATKKAVRPPLAKDDYLLLEEVLGPETGAAADADAVHRQVVRIAADPVQLVDELYAEDLDPATGDPFELSSAPVGANPLPLLEVTWGKEDALTFPLCLSTTLDDGQTVVRHVSVGRGNIGLADHGRTIEESYDFAPPLDGARTFRLRLREGPQTMQIQPDEPTGAMFDDPLERPNLAGEVSTARPAVVLRAIRTNGSPAPWFPAPDLFGRTEPRNHFVVDVDDVGRAVLRFGDGRYGEAFVDVKHIDVRYRVGVGRPGNIGAEALAHIVRPDVPPATWPAFDHLRNPLPATGGVDPELIEEVRQHAPAAVRAKQLRAVTEQDYTRLALTISGVAGAVASFRWTGSWYTVFVGIDPTDPANVITNVRGVTRLEPSFKQRVLDSLTRYRLAGYDLEIRAARYVPLDVEIQLCVKRGYFTGDVAHAVSTVLASSTGLFAPTKFTFGQPVYLSTIYAAVEKVEGVESATVTTFHRWGRDAAGELDAGIVPIGLWEIARLADDPSNMENGVLVVTAAGGS